MKKKKVVKKAKKKLNVNMPDRKEADAVFNDTMKRLNELGSLSNAERERTHQSVNGKDYQSEIRHLQKTAREVINWKQADNQRRGRTPDDGKNY